MLKLRRLLCLTPFFLSSTLASAAVPTPVVDACVPVVFHVPTPPRLTPWVYTDDGEYVWGDHLFYEDPGNTVFTLARDLVRLSPGVQPAALPDVLLFNFAQFEPPEGIAAPAGKRLLMEESLERKGLQLYVNYSGAVIDPASPGDLYFSPTFFASLDGSVVNTQTIPPVPASGFSNEFVSATRGAFGCAFRPGVPHAPAPVGCTDVYVTAGLGYGLSDLDPDPGHQVMAALAQTDRLMLRNQTTGVWSDVAQGACPGGPRIPASAASGNSSGVVFADLTGDGWEDLYVGKPGDRYLGAPNVLLVNDGTGCFSDQTAARIPGEPSRATVDVAAADLDNDHDLDLVVADRCRQSGTCANESEDYVLINDGSGHFSGPIWLNAGQATDTRSVAVGELDSALATPDGWPEIVLGNAGSDGFSNVLTLTDHRMQIFLNQGQSGGPVNTFVDRMDPWLDPFAPAYPIEHEVTAPLTTQVLLTDLFGPAGNPLTAPTSVNAPDGWLDLVVVSHRDILKHDAPFGAASRVYVVSNQANWATPQQHLVAFTAFGTLWGQTAAVADFTGNGYADVFAGAGNRWSGVKSELTSNLGPASGVAMQPWDYSGGFIGVESYETMPGNERGYGFDFGDADGDGFREALQTSRGYNYLVRSILGPAGAEHQDLADPAAGSGQTSNRRGRLVPQGMEDGVFADFDRDGDLDALMASQRTPSQTWPHCDATSPDSMVLKNAGGATFGYDAVTNLGLCETQDARIDLVNRVTHPGIADRAVAGDLDNDGDVDAIVHLFEIFPPGWTATAVPPVTSAYGFTAPIDTYSFGWRYLQNVIGEPGAGSLWFRDVAPTKMKSTAGVYNPDWNRGLGMDVLADFDNNGALDLYTTVGFAKRRVIDFLSTPQTYDLLFLNGTGGATKGTFTESSATALPAPCADVVQDSPGDPSYHSCGSFGLVQGDIDNDGDADAVVTHYSQTGRTNYPSLLVNRLSEPAARMVDEFTSRTPIGSFSDIIHTADVDSAGNPTLDMDDAMFPVLADLDADGDLDLVYQVVADLPRVLLNNGRDSNGDGVINAADTPPPGTFSDATDATLQRLKPTTDAQDIAAVDLDRDGDLDLAIDPFSDRVFFWRNDHAGDPGRPAVTAIWPRVGAVRRQKLRLEGVNLDSVLKVQFRYAGGAICEQTIVAPVGTDGTRLDVVIPHFCPLGLAQVRVLRAAPSCGGGQVQIWSTQYIGYFVLG